MTNKNDLTALIEENNYLSDRVFQLECMLGQQDIEISKLEGSYIDLQNRVQNLERSLKVLSDYIKANQNQTQIASEAEETPPPHY
ncbi:hypothetical protein CKF54_01950 [Psittacicella hinzii]|uniref:Protein SlyX homolog n=1 Tax=Psittacicella hinzii TaxID=2028575 RepID=A0A3A1YCQ8_9GAMM|nr:SlyX family protein [Psittacicella hinzii]RIY34004.1 hypothetical protein CKF54_01950 [Psittacicella hinzii]